MRKKVDARVRTLVENGVKLHHRSLFVIVGDNGREQVVNLHYMLSKATVRARPSVLWCYKKELGFTTHRKKRMRQIKKNAARGLLDPDKEDPFELFISSTSSASVSNAAEPGKASPRKSLRRPQQITGRCSTCAMRCSWRTRVC